MLWICSHTVRLWSEFWVIIWFLTASYVVSCMLVWHQTLSHHTSCSMATDVSFIFNCSMSFLIVSFHDFLGHHLLYLSELIILTFCLCGSFRGFLHICPFIGTIPTLFLGLWITILSDLVCLDVHYVPCSYLLSQLWPIKHHQSYSCFINSPFNVRLISAVYIYWHNFWRNVIDSFARMIDKKSDAVALLLVLCSVFLCFVVD